VRFKDLDAEPRIYAALVGETGSGKGAAWDRSLQIINSIDSGLKIVNSIDSGAGLADYFFESPLGQPVLCYIDEVTGLGNKAAPTRNPAILDAMIELADSTSRSRVLAKRGKNPERVQKTRDDCRLAMVMCGQNRDVYAKALTGRNQLGICDRLIPEYGVPVEPGKMPPIDRVAAGTLMTKILSLNYQLEMQMDPAADARLEAFWRTLVTNAARDNEEHIFEKAWQIHSRVHLDMVKITKTNGHQYDKYVPKPEW
jgi:hypothetical protein